jgi:hypothetical protein
MSFDEIYSPGFTVDETAAKTVLDDYRQSIFGGANVNAAGGEGTGARDDSSAGPATAGNSPSAGATREASGAGTGTMLPSTTLLRFAWHSLINGSFEDFAEHYVFDTRALTNDRPYFAAYVKAPDLLRTLDRLDLFQDESGYLLICATPAAACLLAVLLTVFPVIVAWRLVFSRSPGKVGTVVYFACLGLGYIMVEVGLIGRFTLALTNPTVSASALITGMLFFSGLGSLVSERFVDRARTVMPLVFVAIAILLFANGRFCAYYAHQQHWRHLSEILLHSHLIEGIPPVLFRMHLRWSLLRY